MASRTELGVHVVTEAQLRRRYRTAAGAAAFCFLCLVGVTILHEESQNVWKDYQEAYGDTLVGLALSPLQKESAKEYPVEVRQIHIPGIQRTDRCVSCHVGIEDVRMRDLPLPYRAHSGILLATHPPERFGCTVCHGGIGQSLNRQESCGAGQPDLLHVPFVSLQRIESSCGRCHLALFDTSGAAMPALLRGKLVFRREGCLGCHRVRGKGGSVGPDLTNVGSRNVRAFDFSRVSGPRTIRNWMRRHLLDPGGVSPGSSMPAFALPDEDMRPLIIALRGLFSSTLPPEYLTLPLMKELKGVSPPVEGREGYALFCVACHGREGKGREYANTPFGVPSLANGDFQSVASDDYLLLTMVEGRGGRMMASWSSRVSHLQDRELDEIAGALRKWRSPVRSLDGINRAGSSSSEGEDTFNRMCATCHGANGAGDLAKGINNPDFLARAGDRFLLETIMKGRSNTAMPGWSRLSDRELGNLLGYLRSLQTKPVQSESAMSVRSASVTGNPARGDSLFYLLCSRCHGRFGEGDLGSAILNRDFLRAATDGFLAGTIARGREHTPMFGWTSQARAGKKLIEDDVLDIVAYMRTAPRPDFLPAGAGTGNPSTGKQLFQELCAECHGESGEGKKAPALHNQEFLGAATNGYLLATITLGRRGTPMPSWGTGSPERRRLTAGERKDLGAFIRLWQTVVIRSDALRRPPSF
jgi:mono/diheme cytochrome c family protein